MRKVVFLAPADDEMRAAAVYYEDQAAGLGAAFLDEVERCVDRIAQHPQAGRVLRGHTRRRLVRRFPFGVLYRADGDEIIVVAVMHLRREPGYWHDR
jgi:toxin ParE1/3/4